MSDEDTLYSEKIMQLAQSVAIPHRLSNPDATGHANSMICGSDITIDININDHGHITEIGYDIQACSLTKTAVAIVCCAVIGQNQDEIARAGRVLADILEGNAEPETGIWEDFKYLIPCRDYPARHQSILLIFEAIEDAFQKAFSHKA